MELSNGIQTIWIIYYTRDGVFGLDAVKNIGRKHTQLYIVNAGPTRVVIKFVKNVTSSV